MFNRILGLARPYSRQLIIISVIILAISGLNQIDPFITRSLTDSLVASLQGEQANPFSWFVSLLIFLLVIKFIRTLLNRLSWYLANRFTYAFRFHLKERGFEHLMGLSVDYFDKKISGSLMSKLDRGVTQVTQVINNSGMFFLPNLITAIITAIIVFTFSWALGAVSLLIYLPFTFINWWRFKKQESLEKKEYHLYDRQYGHFWEAIASVRLIKSFLAENFELRRLKTFYRKILNLRQRVDHYQNLATSADLLVDIWTWGMYAYIIFLTWKGQFTIGTMVLLVQYIAMMQRPLWDLNWVFWEVKRAQIGARDYFKILDSQPSLTEAAKPKKLGKVKGRIEFRNVRFAYKPNQPVLSGLSFVVKPKTITAFVGISGAGKTTIANLLSRFYDPQQGKITIDGVDIRQVNQRELRQNIGLVMQDTYLFADTVAENLRYGHGQATLSDMKRACRAAHADEFIAKLPQGYDTLIGERGVKLSGGQKQRLSIARTLLKNPPILILDEATSSLDSHSEVLVQDALRQLIKGRTTLIIAHRLSTVQRAGHIIVLKDGQVYEQGSHEKLVAKNGIYAHLFSIQSGKIKNVAELKKWDLVA